MDYTLETVNLGEQAILEIQTAYEQGVDPEEVAESHLALARAIRTHLLLGTVKKP